MSSSLKQIGKNPIFRFGIIGIALYIALFFIYEPIKLALKVEDINILAITTLFYFNILWDVPFFIDHFWDMA